MRKGYKGIYRLSRKVWRDQRGITGLETAIVLIAFIVVAAVFAFAVLTTGLFSTEKAKGTAQTALKSTQSTLAPKGSVIAEDTGSDGDIDLIRFRLSNAAGSEPVDLATARTLVTYTDRDTLVSVTGDGAGTAMTWTPTWLVGSAPSIDAGEVVEFRLTLVTANLLTADTQFTIEVLPVQGAVVIIQKTTPLQLAAINEMP